MDINLVQPPHQIIPQTTKTRIITAPRFVPATHPWTRFRNTPYRFKSAYTAQVAENDFGLVGDGSQTLQTSIKTLPQIKEDLYQALQGINRGIYGVPSAKKSEIEGLVRLLESQNPTPDPTQNLDKVAGWWKLVYSTITILGSRRTKLGLRDFVTLGNFYQNIEVDKGKAIDVIKFNVRGLSMLNGQLTIEAFFNIASNSRVDIKFEKSTITPDQLMNLFRRNYDLLLGIFNPEGWLDISYVDNTLKIGRDDKGNIFILERCEEPET